MQSTGPQLPSTNDQFSYLTGHGVEKTAIERISSIAQHIGALHKELEKPIQQRNADIIQNEYIEIGRINVALNKLMPGKVLEFAYLDTIPEGQDPSLIRPIVGDCVFHTKVATDSKPMWPPSPDQSGHRFQGKVATMF